LDNCWLVVKGKSNLDIACSPRKFFKKGVYYNTREVKQFFYKGCFMALLSKLKLWIHVVVGKQLDN